MIFRHYSSFKAIFGDLLFPAVPETVLNSSLDYFSAACAVVRQSIAAQETNSAFSKIRKKKKNAEDTAAFLKTARDTKLISKNRYGRKIKTNSDVQITIFQFVVFIEKQIS